MFRNTLIVPGRKTIGTMLRFDIHRCFGHKEIQSNSSSNSEPSLVLDFIDDFSCIRLWSIVLDSKIVCNIQKGFINGVDKPVFLTDILPVNLVNISRYL